MAELTALRVIDTGPFPCNGEDRRMEWVNPWPLTIRVKGMQVWVGARYGTRADIWVWPYRKSDDMVMPPHFNWDHYAEPTSPDHVLILPYSPDWISVGPGDAIVLNYGGNDVIEAYPGIGRQGEAHITVTIWFSFEEKT